MGRGYMSTALPAAPMDYGMEAPIRAGGFGTITDRHTGGGVRGGNHVYGFVITEAGNNLLAKMVAGDKLTITKVVMDKGTAESAEAARKLTAPIDLGPNAGTVPTVEAPLSTCWWSTAAT